MNDAASLVDYMPFLVGGIWVTIKVTILAMLLAVPAAFVLALGRMSRVRILSWSAGFVIETFRGTSALVQLFWAYYVLPFFGLDLSPLVAGVIVLGLNEASYFSEMVRPALQSILAGQRDASIALHLPRSYRFFRITLPQALPLLVPPFGNTAVDMLKFSSLVSLVTLQDLTYRATMVRSAIGSGEAVFAIVLIIYFVLALAIAGGVKQLEIFAVRRAGRPSALSATPVPGWALGR